MNDRDRALAELARRQRQVFSREQAGAIGFDRSAFRRRVHSGLWVPVGPQSYTFAGVELDWRGSLQAGLLDLGPGALVSAEAAAALLQLDSFGEGPLVYLVPRGLRHRTTIGDVRTCGSINRIDWEMVDGLPTTSGTMTVVQLLGRVGPDLLADALDSAGRKRLTAESVVLRRLSELGRQGRKGIADLEKVLEYAGVESWLEREFLKLLPPGFPVPTCQRTYRPGGTRVARVDFDFSPLPIIVEVGGRRGYMSADDRRRKERRRNELQLMGKTIYFFCKEDITDTPAYVLDVLRGCLQIAS